MKTIRHLKNQAIAKILARTPWLVRIWAKRSTFMSFTDIPWTPLEREVKQSKVALLTTGGVHLVSQPSFNMLDSDGDPTFREIPSNASVHDLTITHHYYDHRDADKDINIIFPLERVHDLKTEGDIGEVNHRHFSFMGHIKGRHDHLCAGRLCFHEGSRKV